MAFSNSYTAITGGTLSAAEWNTNIKDNWSAVWPYTTAGDIAYATSAVALARAGIGANGTVFKSNGSAPAWVAQSTLTNIPGQLHTIGMVNFAPGGQAFGSATYADITGATTTLVLAAGNTYRILVLASVTGYHDTVGAGFSIRSVVAGTADPTAATGQAFNGGEARNEGLPYIYTVGGIASGSKIVKLQCSDGGAGTAYVERGRLIALAFVE